MLKRLLGVAVVVLCWAACERTAAPPTPAAALSAVEPDAGDPDLPPPELDAGEPPDAGGWSDAGELPDAGEPPDAGEEPDAGEPRSAGPWPNEPQLDYTARFGVPRVQSIGVDEGYNLWLLDGARIGVLRPGDAKPTWTSGVGQAAGGFGEDRRATGSTVICGGSAGRAYVGYRTYDLGGDRGPVFHDSPSDPEFQKGDLDVVKLNPDGTVALEEHLGRSTDNSGHTHIGLRNTNNWHYDEDRTVFTCTRAMRGPYKGELYIGTNHGVTRIQGLQYNSHRHPVWDVNGSLRIGYDYAVGVAFNGDVLIGNEWKIGIVPPPASLADWDNHEVAPYRLNTYVHVLNSKEEMDYWRAFVQTKDGAYYLGSKSLGLWRMRLTASTNWAEYERVPGLPTGAITSLEATEDGSLFIGTAGHGLWRLDSARALARLSVAGSNVRQVLYDPSVTPAMLYVLSDAGLTVLRGY